MAQRIYWVPHTICFFGCAHCHNDSVLDGIKASRSIIDNVIAHLPPPESRYQLEEVLVGGGEALMRNQQMEYLIRAFRARFPRGPQATVAERRAAGHVILALQTMGMPLADRAGNPAPKQIDYWLDQGVDYFQIASNDMFHERQRPQYPWEQSREKLRAYGTANGVEFMIYGKGAARLVPSGRVLDALDVLEGEGAQLLTASGYCAEAWEAGKHFLTGQENQHPDCSEVVIDPYGWVHPCCWHELSPGLFDLGATDFAAGMAALTTVPFCQAIDAGDMQQLAECADIDGDLAARIRDTVGDCGTCRLCSAKLAQSETYAWVKSPALTDRERRFYTEHLGETTMHALHMW